MCAHIINNSECSAGVFSGKNASALFIYAVFALILSSAVLSVTVIPASAYSTEFDVWVNGVRFDRENEETGIECGDGFAYYNHNSYTVTLDNATISTSDIYGYGIHGEYDNNLTIVLVGENTIEAGPKNFMICSIFNSGNITIKGDGTLRIDSSVFGINSRNGNISIIDGNVIAKAGSFIIYPERGNVFINNGSVELLSGNCGIYIPDGNIEITDSNVSMDSVNLGISSINGSLDISGSGLAINAELTGISTAQLPVNISECTLSITAANGSGIFSSESPVSISDSNISISAASFGIFAENAPVRLSGCNGEIYAENGSGISSDVGDISIENCSLLVLAGISAEDNPFAETPEENSENGNAENLNPASDDTENEYAADENNENDEDENIVSISLSAENGSVSCENSSLNLASSGIGIFASNEVFIAKSRTQIKAKDSGILSDSGDISVPDGNLTVTAENYAVSAENGSFIVSSGPVSLKTGSKKGRAIVGKPDFHAYNSSYLHIYVSSDPAKEPVDWDKSKDLTKYPVVEIIPNVIYLISAGYNPYGTITPSGKTYVYAGKSITYQMKAIDGWHISDVLIDNESIGPVSTYTFENVSANHTILIRCAEGEPEPTPTPVELSIEDLIEYLVNKTPLENESEYDLNNDKIINGKDLILLEIKQG